MKICKKISLEEYMSKKYDQSGRYSGTREKRVLWTYSEKNGWQMDARNTGMVSERM
jgi:hypothetical protein